MGRHPFGTEMDELKHEAKCERCGISCHIQNRDEEVGDVAIQGLHCKFLKKEGSHFTCTVYKDRYEKASWCHSAVEASPQGMLRTDCPYNDTGKGKIRLSPDDYDKWWEKRSGIILATVHPHFVSTESFLSELKRRHPDKEWVARKDEAGWIFEEKGNPSVFIIRPWRG